MQRSNVCPVCKTQWDGKSYVGERSITTSESYQKGKRRSNNRQPSEEQEQVENEAEQDDAEEEDEG